MNPVKRAIVTAYAFSPTLGSEFAQGWNYVQQMKSRYQLTVLVGSSDGRMGDFSLLNHPDVLALGNEVDIVRIEPDWFCRFIKRLDVGFGLTWLFVWGLRRWHRLAFERARQLHERTAFDAAHQLGPVGFRNPGYLYRLGIPSYWGPIGGFQYIKLGLAFRSSARYGAVSLLRNVSTYLSARSGAVRAAVRGFTQLSFATETNRRNFEALYGVSGPVLSDQATVSKVDGDRVSSGPDKPVTPPLRVVWCGSVDARKNIRLLLDIAHRLSTMNSPVQFTTIGAGPLLSDAMRHTRDLKNIHFTGQIPRAQVQQHFKQAHVLCFTSLSEANTSTFFEALAADCIPVALDLDGFSSNINDDIGCKVSPNQGWPNIVQSYAQTLHGLATDATQQLRYVDAIHRAATRFSWKGLADKHADVLNSLAQSR